jgi:uncharacterized protein YkwD
MFKKKKKKIKINLLIDGNNEDSPKIEEKSLNSIYDLFIPHQGNNFYPQALKPKRLFFHGAVLLLVKAIIISFIFAYPIEAYLTPDLAREEGQKVIKLTNVIRAGLGVKPLRENDRLDRAAFDKAQDMMVNEYFDHISPKKIGLAYWLSKNGYSFRSAGENLAMGFETANDIVGGWKNSRTHYMNMIDPEFTEIGVGLVSGKFKNQDMTVAAQLFGAPENSTRNDKESFQNNTLKIKTENGSHKEHLKSENTAKAGLLASKIIKSMVRTEPTLLAPFDNALLADRLVKFEISAPQADSIVIYIDQKPFTMKNLSFEESNPPKKYYYELAKVVDPGPHIVSIKSVIGNKELFSKNYNFTIDNSAPQADLARSKFVISPIPGESKSLVAADVFLSADTASAQLEIDGRYFALNQDSEDFNRWTMQEFIEVDQDQKDSHPIVLANVTSVDHAGRTMVTDIPYSGIEPQKSSFIDKYFFLKDHQNKYLSGVFNIGSAYYRLMLFILILAMALNMFIEIKKQKPQAVISSFGLLCLLAVLIVF